MPPGWTKVEHKYASIRYRLIGNMYGVPGKRQL